MSILEYFSSLNSNSRFDKIHINVLQPLKAGDKGKSVNASSGGHASSVSDVSANSVRPDLLVGRQQYHLHPLPM
jgi:hypothetical protein